jgi:hemolysin D
MDAIVKSSGDPGLFVLEMLLRLQGRDVNAQRLRRSVGDGLVGVAEMLRCADEFALAGRCFKTDWDRLAALPLPGIAVLRGGDFLLLGKVSADKAIVLAPDAQRPTMITRAEFASIWDGRVVLMRKRGVLARFLRRLDPRRPVAALCRSLSATGRRAVKPKLSQMAGLWSTAGAVVIDFAEYARKVRHVVPLPKLADGARAGELAFLPAVLEIQETPPSPLGRAIAYSIMGVFAVAIAWASFGTVDIVAVAPGKIIPSGRTKTIQPFETSVVRSIRVHDGQNVKTGEVLVELDTTMSAAELGHLRSDLMAGRLEVARLRAALTGTDAPLAAFTPPEGAPAELIEMQRRLLVSQTTEQTAKLAAIDRQIAQKDAERATIKASIDKLEAIITPLQQRVDIHEQLFQKGLGSKITYLTEAQELIGQKQDVLVQQSRYAETDAAVAALVETRSKTVAEYQRSLLDEQAKAEQKVGGLSQDVIKAEQRISFQTLRAPVDGVVQQLAIHTVGGVVTPAQSIMVIVPAESSLEVEAMIPNRDIGFVEAGQDAAIKVDTFNFTRYGLLHGKIVSVSQDAITRDKPQDRGNEDAQGAQSSSSEPKGQELIYAARISLDRSQMAIEDKRVNLSPGMAVTAEIKTGSRTIMSYLLSPLSRYAHDSLRER